ncbi:hypothetical protein NA57DRAFT_69987 [Rhizodiscina lignyota]|uniref:Uncharacterized protein n=1 Tax=Rhizodiscina lignyota TaxID=1504668 RepID=A0A9P4IPR4_9PEZI|nr:hypothetical protein NA57DRAFT_69987 [Rhizodiscina lignyota]
MPPSTEQTNRPQDRSEPSEFMLTQQSPSAQSHGIWRFVVGNPTVFVALIGGLSLILASFGFTYWLSLQTLSCPSWAMDCKVVSSPGYKDPQSTLPMIQGIISLVHGLGLACLFFVATALAEPTLWPLLSRKSYTLAVIDTYLQGTRGSLLSLLKALFHVKDHFAVVVLLSLAVVAVLSQVDRIIIGQVYSLQNATKTYQSAYQEGGGIGIGIPPSNQNYPLADPAINGFAFYTAWAKALDNEPLPDMREFIVDRYNLSSLEGFTVSALKAQKSIICSARPLTISQSQQGILEVAAEHSNTSVLIRTDPRLSCWIDSTYLVSPMASITTLMFTATNGYIEGGEVANFSDFNITDSNITSLQCDVMTELLQARYTYGSGGPKVTKLSANATVGYPASISTWMGGAVTTFGVKIYDARPMFGVGLSENRLDSTILPQTYATVYVPGGHGWGINSWSQSALKNFVNVTSGAVAIAMSKQKNKGRVIVHSNFSTPKLNTAKSFLLLLPTALILSIIASLCMINIWSHKVTRIQQIRPATIPEWTESSRRVGISEAFPEEENKTLTTVSEAELKEVRCRLRNNGYEDWWLEID